MFLIEIALIFYATKKAVNPERQPVNSFSFRRKINNGPSGLRIIKFILFYSTEERLCVINLIVFYRVYFHFEL